MRVRRTKTAVPDPLRDYAASLALPSYDLEDLDAFGELIRGTYPVITDTSCLRMLSDDATGYGVSGEDGLTTALEAFRVARNLSNPIGAADEKAAERVISERAGSLFGKRVRRTVMMLHLCAVGSVSALDREIERCDAVSLAAHQLRRSSLEWDDDAALRSALAEMQHTIVPFATTLSRRATDAKRVRALITGRTATRKRGRPNGAAAFWSTRYLEWALPEPRVAYMLSAAIACVFRFETSPLPIVTENFRLGPAHRRPISSDRLIELYPIDTKAY